MAALLAHLAQEDSHLPPGPEHIGSVTRVVHELTVRLARRHPLILGAVHHPGDVREEEANGVRYLRFGKGADTAVLGSLYRWRNRIGRWFGIEERPYAASRAYFHTYIRRVARRLAREDPDLVHLHNVSQFVPPLRDALPRARLVLQMHCEWLVELPPHVIARRLAAVDLVLGVSQHIVRQIQTAFPEVADRCRVLHNGIDPVAFPPRERVAARRGAELAALRAGYGICGPVILYVGRLSAEKGVHVLLEAFSRVRVQHRTATCILVGPDWGPIRRVRDTSRDPGSLARLDHDYVGHLRRQSAPHGDRVVLAGAVPNHDLSVYYALADVLVAPSLIEAFGLPAVEASASGLPVVASATGGLLDTVVPDLSGLLVPPGDAAALARAIEQVLGDPARASALGRAGRDRVLARFTWDRIAETLAAYYESILGRAPADGAHILASRAPFDAGRLAARAAP